MARGLQSQPGMLARTLRWLLLWSLCLAVAADARPNAVLGFVAPQKIDRGEGKRASTKKKRRGRGRKKSTRRRRRLLQLRDGPGFVVREPDKAWGTPLAIQRLRSVLAAYHEQLPDAPPMIIHDLSRKWGGRLPPHSSHRGGRDVDIRLALRAPYKKYVPATPRMLHIERTWTLIKLLFDTCDVQEILLDRRLQRALYRYAHSKLGYSKGELWAILEYPGHRHRKLRPMVIHWRGHADHMHVRFRPATRPRKALATIERRCWQPPDDALAKRTTRQSEKLRWDPASSLKKLGL